MGKLSVRQTLEVEASASTAWEVVGPNFLHIADWGRGVNKSWDNELATGTLAGAPAGGRFCEVAGFGTFDERIIHYDADSLAISWSAEGEKLPPFLSGLQNALKVESLGEGQCRVSSHLTADLSGILGFIMGGFIKKNFSKTLAGFLSDWKTYAETGQVSATKQRELAKLAE